MAYEIDLLDSFTADVMAVLSEIGSLPFRAKLMAEIDREISVLRDMPCLHAVSRKPVSRRRELREAFILGYSLVYRFRKDRIQLIRFFHQRQNYDRAGLFNGLDL